MDRPIDAAEDGDCELVGVRGPGGMWFGEAEDVCLSLSIVDFSSSLKFEVGGIAICGAWLLRIPF